MSFQYLYCGAWSFKAPVSGVTAFKAVDGRAERIGVYGTDVPVQSIQSLSGNRLVSVSERRGGGSVVSYRVMPDGALEKTDVLECKSGLLSYILLSSDGNYAFVSSMDDATVKMIRVEQNGTLTLTDEWRLTGHSVTPRQESARVHSVMLSPDGALLAAANLGADEIALFRVDYEKETLHLTQSVPVDFGRQPRHMAFHPSGKWLYLLTESGNRVYVYRILDGKLQETAAYPTLDPEGKQGGMAADIVVSPDGRFVYASNRAQNNIAVWRTLNSGLLDVVGYFDSFGNGPRGLNISADGETLFCANNEGGTVTILALDRVTGKPGALLQTLELPFVSCVRSI